jgi:catechol 2,3-dioxygenase-like lactoylglutathione lyase family enzyme
MENQLTSIINNLQHIGIPVTDIAASEFFYSRFGFKNVMQSTFTIKDEEGVCIMMKYKDIIIELYQMPEEQLQEIKKRKDGHIDHIAFDVTDAEATFLLLKKEHFNIVEDEPVLLSSFWENGCKYFNVIGPDGERLEFNEIKKN